MTLDYFTKVDRVLELISFHLISFHFQFISHNAAACEGIKEAAWTNFPTGIPLPCQSGQGPCSSPALLILQIPNPLKPTPPHTGSTILARKAQRRNRITRVISFYPCVYVCSYLGSALLSTSFPVGTEAACLGEDTGNTMENVCKEALYSSTLHTTPHHTKPRNEALLPLMFGREGQR